MHHVGGRLLVYKAKTGTRKSTIKRSNTDFCAPRGNRTPNPLKPHQSAGGQTKLLVGAWIGSAVIVAHLLGLRCMRPAIRHVARIRRRPDDQPDLLSGGRGQGWPEAIAKRRVAPLTPGSAELTFNVGPSPPSHRLTCTLMIMHRGVSASRSSA